MIMYVMEMIIAIAVEMKTMSMDDVFKGKHVADEQGRTKCLILEGASGQTRCIGGAAVDIDELFLF